MGTLYDSMGYEDNWFLRELKEFSCSSPLLKSGGGLKTAFPSVATFLEGEGMRSNKGLAIFWKTVNELAIIANKT